MSSLIVQTLTQCHTSDRLDYVPNDPTRNSANPRKPTPMTSRALARELDVSESYVSYLRAGGRMPSAQVLSNLIANLGLDARAVMNAYREGPEGFSAFLLEQIPRVD